MSSLKRLFQGSLLGNYIHSVSNGRLLKHPEDYTTYIPDKKYNSPGSLSQGSEKDSGTEGSNTQIQVTFDGPDDPEHPHNWALWVKIIVGLSTSALSALVYIASVIFMPAKSYIMEEFHIGETASNLPLTLFVYGYALGPMIFSPLSEHPQLGRNFFYASTLLLFAVLQIPTALVQNFAGLCLLRFIAGIFISPVLATGGASFADMYSLPYVPHAMVTWGIGSFSGASLGPLLGAALVVASDGWRWSFWLLLIFSGCLFVVFLCIVPETYGDTILYRKAQRLRRVTGNTNITVYADGKSVASHDLKEILWRPIVIGFTEPVVILINFYIAFIYGVMYLWLEAFPILFSDAKGFGTVSLGVTYMAIVFGVVLGSLLYSEMLFGPYTKQLIAGKQIHPEVFIPVAIVGSLFMPSGIFIFGWTGAKDIHWIAPIIGVVLYGISGIIMFQSLLSYIGNSFPRYIASAFAGNALVRSFCAGSFPLFGKIMFTNLQNDKFPVAWGCTIIGCISTLAVSIPVLFYLNGPRLRARSRYSGT